jgi:hypothetical protein
MAPVVRSGHTGRRVRWKRLSFISRGLKMRSDGHERWHSSNSVIVVSGIVDRLTISG